MSVELKPGYIISPGVLPSYAGQSFEFMAEGTVGRFSGEEHQSDSSLGAGYMVAPALPAYAGDAFEGPINLHSYNYPPYLLTGFLGPGQEESGGCTLGAGYTVETPSSIPVPPIP